MPDELVYPPDRSEFDHWVHDALNRLYDSAFLETHPLVEVLVKPQELTGRRSQDLRRVLVSAIQFLRPSKNVPQHSHDWRGYQILEQRFISGLSPNEVMQRLGMGRSLFYLEQARILETLVDLLWQQRAWAVESEFAEGPGKKQMDKLEEEQAITPGEDQADMPGEGQALPQQKQLGIDTEMLRLLGEAVWEPVSLDTLLEKLGLLAEPLAQASQVRLSIETLCLVTIPHANRVLLRQVLLSQITGLLEKISGGSLTIQTFCSPPNAGIRLAGQPPENIQVDPGSEKHQGISPDASRRILSAMGGSLEMAELASGGFSIHLAWKQPDEAMTLLVVDDNAGMVELIRRYLDGTAWRVIAASSGEQARRLLAEANPQITGGFPTLFILDVILPEEDGWEVLISLKSDPATRAIPVIVCSAINEPQLMASLGAAAYLPKPVTRLSLLQAIASWSRPAANPAPGPPEMHPTGG